MSEDYKQEFYNEISQHLFSCDKGEVKDAMSKLSELQRFLLTRVFETVDYYLRYYLLEVGQLPARDIRSLTVVKWNPRQWVSPDHIWTNTVAAKVSRSLRRLEKRGLIIRHGADGEFSGRTVMVELTGLGYAAGKRLTSKYS